MAVDDDDFLDPEFHATLRAETGWHEVSKGFAQMLFGYAGFFVSCVMGIMILVSPFLGAPTLARVFGMLQNPTPGLMWTIMGGLAVLGLGSFFSYWLIWVGELKCMIYAPEREAARWIMFFCMTTLCASPVLSLIPRLPGVPQMAELKKGARGEIKVEMTRTGMLLQGTSEMLAYGHSILFTLFLRAIAVGLRSKPHINLVNLNLAITLALIGFTLYLRLGVKDIEKHLPLVLACVGLWLLQTIFWITLLVLVRGLIESRMANLKSPFAAPTYSPSPMRAR